MHQTIAQGMVEGIELLLPTCKKGFDAPPMALIQEASKEDIGAEHEGYKPITTLKTCISKGHKAMFNQFGINLVVVVNCYIRNVCWQGWVTS